jgi:hypothetical protein
MISLPKCREAGFTTEIKVVAVDDGGDPHSSSSDLKLHFNAYHKDGKPKYTGLTVLSHKDAWDLIHAMEEILDKRFI